MDTITPPTMAVITPAIAGASLAIASPKPSGRAIKLTTNPENTFLGSCLKKSAMLFFLDLIE
jgi:hypothetical protein